MAKKIVAVTQEVKRGDFDNVIFLGIQGKDRLDKALEYFTKEYPEKHVYIMNKEIYNKTVESFVRQHAKFKEDRAMQEMTADPENLKRANGIMQMFHGQFGSDWFTVADVVNESLKLESTGQMMTYKMAKDFLDLLFAFGYQAHSADPDQPSRTRYRIIRDLPTKIKYLDNLLAGMEEDYENLKEVKKQVEEELASETKKHTEPIDKTSKGLKIVKK